MPFDGPMLKQAKQAPIWVRQKTNAAWTRFKALKPRQKWIVGAMVVLGLGLLMLGAGMVFGSHKSQVITEVVRRQDIERSVLASGVIEPTRLVSVGAQVSGQVKRLYVVLGQSVKAGEPIADIDSSNQQNSVSTARAQLENVKAQRASAEASFKQAQSTYARQQQLLKVDAISRADFETAEAALGAARASANALDAQIREAQVSLSNAQTNLGYTRIVAPMNGVVVAVVTEQGQTVNATQAAPTIVKLAQLDQMTISAEISEADVIKVREGQSVYFTTLGDTVTRHYAALRAIAPAPNSIKTSDEITVGQQAIYYNALFDVDNADGKLRTGMTAQVSVVLQSAKNALSVPSSALKGPGPDGKYLVRVRTPSGAIEPRKVKIGINNNVSAQVLEGLAEGDKVVVGEADPGAAKAAASNANNRMRPPGGMMMGGPPRGAR